MSGKPTSEKALVVVQSTRKTGKTQVSIQAEGVEKPYKLEIESNN